MILTSNKSALYDSNLSKNILDSDSTSTQPLPPLNKWSKYKEYKKKLVINDFEIHIDLSFY